MKTLLLIIAGVAACLGVGAVVVSRSRAGHEVGSTVTGSVEATEIEIAGQIGGRIAELPVQEGQNVTRGQLLVALDDREARLRVEQLRARIAVAQAELEDLIAAPRKAEVRLQRSRVHEAEVALGLARKRLERQQTLAERRAAPPADVDEASFSLKAAQQRAETERRSLNLIGAPPKDTQQEIARARVATLEAELHIAELEVERARITAPVDGIIARRHHELGEIVAAGQPLLTLIDPRQMWVELAVPARLHARLVVGQDAMVDVEGSGDPPFAGHVSYVAERHIFTPRNVQTREERALLTFRAKVAIDQPPPYLKPGMYVDVRFTSAAPRLSEVDAR